MKFPFWICHQKPERCFKYKGKPLPLCSRCLFLYSFLIFGFILSILFNLADNFDKKEMLFFIIFLNLPLFVDSITQFFKIRESTNILRSITGFLSGLSLGIGLHYLTI